eukprot:TRINITY_DN6551_c0_g1_i1.p1 TRINITY_DN6551_c0_g1~~TRINITY_DN6551_c0_g1_i1.p1  ORF type:complete len:257 (+),score=27.18 TRINITY_DN6551_c0_g1_i1:50-772(+)
MSLLTFATSAAAFMSELLDAADNLGWPTDDVTSGYIEAVTASIISNGGAESDEMRAQLQERGMDVDAMMERMKAKGTCKVLVDGQSTPLQSAECSDDVAATTTCLALGVPPDKVGHGGPGCTMTPLVLAICLHNRSRGRGSNLSSIAPLLLAAGADPRQRMSGYFASKSLVQRAAERRNVKLVALLLAAGADRAHVTGDALLASADLLLHSEMIAKLANASGALETLKQHAIRMLSLIHI